MKLPVRPIGAALALSAFFVTSACSSAPAPSAPTVATAAAPAVATAASAASPVAAAASPAAATAIAAASPAAATVVAAASPAAATAVAAASPIAAAASPAVATAIAAGSPAASPAIATAVAASPVRITGASLNPTDSTVTVQNAGSAAVDMAGWRMRAGTASVALPSGARVGPNESITIHTAAGTNGARDIYLGADAATLLAGMRPGASVALLDAQGAVVTEFTLPG